MTQGALAQAPSNGTTIKLEVPNHYSLALWVLALASVAAIAIQVYTLSRSERR